MDKPQPIILCLITPDIFSVCITSKQKWIKVMEELKKLDPNEIIDFGETWGKEISIKSLLQNIKVYDSGEHLHAYQLLFGDRKYLGSDLVADIKDGIAVLKDEVLP